ncbi:MAG: DUF1186 domain-containing protein [Anaerolineales bacterium]|nr:DUF1186 domain-containing protein [Anaerolineales bacterium]
MSEMYSEQVAQLLTLGYPDQEDEIGSEWLDYCALGLTAEHVPELVQMIMDKDLHWDVSDIPEIYAPVHARRALGQLRAESAVDSLLQLLRQGDEKDENDEWVLEELPHVFGMIGPAAIPGLGSYLTDINNSDWSRISASNSLVEIVELFPENRETVIDIFSDQLRLFADQERIFNAYLVSALCSLKAVESAAVIEQAFVADAVDLSVLGDWEEAQIFLGLLEKRVTPAPDFFAMELGLPPSFGNLPGGKSERNKTKKQKKTKRKQAKASRKRNRRR